MSVNQSKDIQMNDSSVKYPGVYFCSLGIVIHLAYNSTCFYFKSNIRFPPPSLPTNTLWLGNSYFQVLTQSVCLYFLNFSLKLRNTVKWESTKSFFPVVESLELLFTECCCFYKHHKLNGCTTAVNGGKCTYFTLFCYSGSIMTLYYRIITYPSFTNIARDHGDLQKWFEQKILFLFLSEGIWFSFKTEVFWCSFAKG